MGDKYEKPIPLNVEAAPDKNNMVFRYAKVKKAKVKP
jgi:hypothetical protein|tara:strand:+ start:1778 stop:1888 length:111 start_codon:yes stop_codon:yes gene_type:complete